MRIENFINYQGSKSNIIHFIMEGIRDYIKPGDCVLDLFLGSGAVSSALDRDFIVYANDVEPYSATLGKTILLENGFTENTENEIKQHYKYQYAFLKNEMQLGGFIRKEQELLKQQNIAGLRELYDHYPTVWNNESITPAKLREEDNYNLFCTYYAGSYFGIKQAVEIDSLVYAFDMSHQRTVDALFSCLFYAMKEAVFSKDGHMAQPLVLEKYPARAIRTRRKSIYQYFVRILRQIIADNHMRPENKNKVFNQDFESLIANADVMKKVDLVYADPPYTDMQYSRYYHLLNVARNYNYPELTKTSRGYTKGLYTEGRFQSNLSKKSKAKHSLEILMKTCAGSGVILALSYAYPQNVKVQATNRYTVSIEELLEMARAHFSPQNVDIRQIDYTHTNNRNSQGKSVIEYLILCGESKNKKPSYDIVELKRTIGRKKPTNRNPMYNTHLYWSQKAFNIINELIDKLSKPGDVIFDPFMGSGVTILESIKKGTNRAAIGCDVNEMPIFIVKVLLNDSFSKRVKIELEQYIKRISALHSFYSVNCPKCNSQVIVDRVLFDKPNRTSNEVTIKAVNYKCEACGTKNAALDYDFVYQQMYRNYSLENIDANTKLIQNSKIAVGENDSIKDIFTARNLAVLDQMLEIAKDFSAETQNVIKYILMSFMHQCKITDKRSNSQWPLWIPKKDCVERNIIEIMTKKTKSFYKALSYIYKEYESKSLCHSFSELTAGKAMLLHKGSQYISEDDIPDKSVSLIITDPPYLEQVLYSEYMQLYAPILNLSYNLEDEIVVSSAPSRTKTRSDYFNLLEEVFEMCSRKLKTGGYMCLYFHDSDLSVWYELINSLYLCGFEFVSQVHIKKKATLKNIISPKKSLNGDSILFFVNTGVKREYGSGKENLDEIERNLVKEARFMLNSQGALSTPELYDNGLMEIMIQNGWLKRISESYASLIDIFEKHLIWDASLGKWSAD